MDNIKSKSTDDPNILFEAEQSYGNLKDKRMVTAIITASGLLSFLIITTSFNIFHGIIIFFIVFFL